MLKIRNHIHLSYVRLLVVCSSHIYYDKSDVTRNTDVKRDEMFDHETGHFIYFIRYNKRKNQTIHTK